MKFPIICRIDALIFLLGVIEADVKIYVQFGFPSLTHRDT